LAWRSRGDRRAACWAAGHENIQLARVVGLATSLGLAACGPALVQVGADVAAGGMKSGTSAVASGGSPSGSAAAGVAVGAGLMAVGYKLTDPSRRQVATPNPPPYMFNAAPPPVRQ
jgi:hypothetical protein